MRRGFEYRYSAAANTGAVKADTMSGMSCGQAELLMRLGLAGSSDEGVGNYRLKHGIQSPGRYGLHASRSDTTELTWT
jgi:hypothetical protein